ncbi:MAG: type 1 glutamine amidotransferase [Planctomycetota bacterium]
MTPPRLRFLLMQVRDAGDPVIAQEVRCFAETLGCEPSQLTTHSLLEGPPPRALLDANDLVLIGGSGDYSAASPIAAGENPWLASAFDALRDLHADAKPTFASCWGFQAFCRALGGDCVRDEAAAELGSIPLNLTNAGRDDPVFGVLPSAFLGHAGHQDRVNRLPPDAVLLASSDRVAEQAVRFADKPIYATQFHPELTRATLIERVEAYPEYVEQIAGVPLPRFAETLAETPDANTLISKMVQVVFG